MKQFLVVIRSYFLYECIAGHRVSKDWRNMFGGDIKEKNIADKTYSF